MLEGQIAVSPRVQSGLSILSSLQVEVDAASPAIKKLGGKLLALELVDSFSADGQRTAVVVSKAGEI